ncbi:MAG: hypothetical protein LBT16_03270 [Treponema sp.]|jgi:hypothetical protein|nr:hypothetical protein [Treponema sp.]
MEGGKPSGNSADGGSCGGVQNGFVYDYSGASTFTMTGGEISGNTAGSVGGGVYSSGYFMQSNYGSTFTKTGGTIYGDTNTAHTAGSKENTATGGNGHAVYGLSVSDVVRKRNSTAGPGVNLDSDTAANWE